jgi:glycosyltransferase involved in cell wall biosynthesis
MYKIVVFSSVYLSAEPDTSTGTWVKPVVLELLKRHQILMFSWKNCKEIEVTVFHGARHISIPIKYLKRLNKLPMTYLGRINDEIESFTPDFYHVWGLESGWGRLIADSKILKKKIILDVQGLQSSCGEVYTAGMSLRELISCISLKEILKRRSIMTDKYRHLKEKQNEIDIINCADVIFVPSPWMAERIRGLSNCINVHLVDLPIRDEFAKSDKWEFEERVAGQDRPNIFFMISGPIAYKGLHTAIDALNYLVNDCKLEIELKIAGNLVVNGIKTDGYTKWILRKIRKYRLVSYVHWLGPLDSKDIVREMKSSSVNLVCSFVESYCLALEEALYLGLPCVSTFNGGSSYLGDSDSIEFFVPGDHITCAMKIKDVIFDIELSKKLSQRAIDVSSDRHSIKEIGDIYEYYYEQTLGQ